MRLDWHWATDRQLGNGFEHFKTLCFGLGSSYRFLKHVNTGGLGSSLDRLD